MKRISVLLAIALCTTFASAYWQQLGDTSQYIVRVVKTERGDIVAGTMDGVVKLLDDSTWSSPVCTGFMVNDLLAGGDDTVFVAQGFGTYSDGVKAFAAGQMGDFVDNTWQVLYAAHPQKISRQGDSVVVATASGVSWFVPPSQGVNTTVWQSVKTRLFPPYAMGVESGKCRVLDWVGQSFMGTLQLVAGGCDIGPMSGGGSLLRCDGDTLLPSYATSPVASSVGYSAWWMRQLAVATLDKGVLVTEWDTGLDFIVDTFSSVIAPPADSIRWRSLPPLFEGFDGSVYGVAHLWGGGSPEFGESIYASCDDGVFCYNSVDSSWTLLDTLPSGLPRQLMAGTGGGDLVDTVGSASARIFAVSTTGKLYGWMSGSSGITAQSLTSDENRALTVVGSHVRFSNPAGAVCKLYSLNGQCIFSRAVAAGMPSVDMSEFGVAPGLYLVSISEGFKTMTRSVVMP